MKFQLLHNGEKVAEANYSVILFTYVKTRGVHADAWQVIETSTGQPVGKIVTKSTPVPARPARAKTQRVVKPKARHLQPA